MTMNGGGLGIAHLAEIEIIERGPSEAVYSALDTKLERPVMVRVLEPLTDEAERVRFGQESRILGSLSSHPNVETVYDAGFTDDGRPFLISEHIDGANLAIYLQQRRALPWTEACDIALQLGAGLDQAHRTGALHRDLRPENVMMLGTAPKLTNFGISRGPNAEPSSLQAGDPATMLHRAPETFEGIWDERTDLYSLASILYELIDGHSPFWRPGQDTFEGLRLRVANEQPPVLLPELGPAALNVFVTAGMSKDPMDRSQTADEFLRELRLVREGRTTGSTPSVLHGTPLVSVGAVASAAAAPAVPSAAAAPAVPSAAATPAVPSAAATPAVISTLAPATAFQAPAPHHQPMVPPPPSPDAQPSLFPDLAGTSTPAAFHQPAANPGGEMTGAGGTAVYTDFVQSQPPPPPGPQTEIDLSGGDGLPPSTDSPQLSGRSPAFLAALAMIIVGLVGLLAVLAIGALGSDDGNVGAPALPDPNNPAAIDAGGLSATTGVAGATVEPDATAGGDAMADDEVMAETTTTQAAEQSTTQTTVPRLPVPNLVGQNVEAASRTLADQGFEVLIVGRKIPNATPGIVTQQKPDAGDLVALPITVTLYIPKISNLPTMVQRSADAVCLELQALALTCTRTLQYNDQVPVGVVIATDPVGGSLFSEGTSVELFVSRGPVVSGAIPDITGQTREEAGATLMNAGFGVLNFADQTSETVAAGRSIGTNPAAGTAHAVDQLITVLISTGPPPPVTIPDLVGMEAAIADGQLVALGLTAVVTTMDFEAGSPEIGKVVSVDPPAGTEVAVGSAVTITVGQVVPAESSDQ